MSLPAAPGQRVAVYLLYDPREPKVPKYVGSAYDPKNRLLNHLNPARSAIGEKDIWIKELRQMGLKPRMEVVEWLPAMEAASLERNLFYKHRDTLFNKQIPRRHDATIMHLPLDVRRIETEARKGYIRIPREWAGRRVRVELLD